MKNLRTEVKRSRFVSSDIDTYLIFSTKHHFSEIPFLHLQKERRKEGRKDGRKEGGREGGKEGGKEGRKERKKERLDQISQFFSDP